jgi:hypothetical protein
MKNLLFMALVLAVVIGAVGYWRGWFNVTDHGKVEVQVDKSNFNQDKKAFSKSVGEKASAIKAQVERLWDKSNALTGDEKAQTQKELTELKTKHDRLVQQIKELDDAGEDKFESIKKDLSRALEDVEKKSDELTKKLEKATGH